MSASRPTSPARSGCRPCSCACRAGCCWRSSSRSVLRIELTTARAGLSLALEVGAGECVALAGPSGAGKTTVLQTIAGLFRPERGVVACGPEVWLDTARGVFVAPERRRCGYVFQDYALFPHLNAWRNVAYGIYGNERRKRAYA